MVAIQLAHAPSRKSRGGAASRTMRGSSVSDSTGCGGGSSGGGGGVVSGVRGGGGGGAL